MSDIFGFLNVDKLLGMTSHDVVHKIRRGLRVKKVGHAGTLDPLATGVLVICLGHATRLSEYVMASQKRYMAQITLGRTTTTYDAEGETVTEVAADSFGVAQADVEAILSRFTGEIDQLPPMHSAVKQGGKKLYELARAGEVVERRPRRVHIDALTIREWDFPHFTLDVTCGAGTYIRSLAHDIGAALTCGAYLAGLRRTASGMFSADDALNLSDLLEDDNWLQKIILPEVALNHMPALYLDDGDVEHVKQGRNPQMLTPPPQDDLIASAYHPDGSFMAIMRSERGNWRPHKVFHRED